MSVSNFYWGFVSEPSPGLSFEPSETTSCVFHVSVTKKRHLAARLNSISQLNTVAAAFPETNPTTYTCTEDLVAKPSVTNFLKLLKGSPYLQLNSFPLFCTPSASL